MFANHGASFSVIIKVINILHLVDKVSRMKEGEGMQRIEATHRLSSEESVCRFAHNNQ